LTSFKVECHVVRIFTWCSNTDEEKWNACHIGTYKGQLG